MDCTGQRQLAPRFGALNFETQAGEEFSADGSAKNSDYFKTIKYRRINGLPNVTLMFGAPVGRYNATVVIADALRPRRWV